MRVSQQSLPKTTNYGTFLGTRSNISRRIGSIVEKKAGGFRIGTQQHPTGFIEGGIQCFEATDTV